MAKQCGNGCKYGVFSKGLCKSCWNREYGKPIKKTPLKRSTTPINKVSDKRAKQLAEYEKLRLIFLNSHTTCELKVDNECTVESTEVHHAEGKENELLLKVSSFRAACRRCHDKVTEDSKSAIENGQSISRHKKHNT